ncbi:uncharacterized protein LOC117118445, partial [Anneissia japonica]|uniref:uncharacterized protein LOC117118445 n=1 Tax=Anneissia japonica TaxID=1529436 RepID=UPI0014255B82
MNRDMEKTAKKAHDDLMDLICRDLKEKEVKLYKKRLSTPEYGGFRAGEVENMKTMEDVLSAQEKRRIFTIGDYSMLKEQLQNIPHDSLVVVVTQYEKKLRDQGVTIKQKQESMDAEPYVTSPGLTNTPGIPARKDQGDCYPAGNGYVVYISIFVKEKDHTGHSRDGVLVDKRNIRRFFKGREFTFEFFEDTRTPEELWEIIDDVKKDAEDSSSFFFIISSHGKGITLKNESGGAELHKDTQKPVVISEEIRLVETNAYVRVDEIVSKFEHFMI